MRTGKDSRFFNSLSLIRKFIKTFLTSFSRSKSFPETYTKLCTHLFLSLFFQGGNCNLYFSTPFAGGRVSGVDKIRPIISKLYFKREKESKQILKQYIYINIIFVYILFKESKKKNFDRTKI